MDSTKLEDNFLVQRKPSPLVIYDWMVHAHVTYEAVKDLVNYVSEAQWNNLVLAAWVYSLNRGPEFLPQSNWRVVVVNDGKDDSGGYWRKHVGATCPEMHQAWEEYCEKHGEAERKYKGNRSGRDEVFWKAEGIGKAYAEKFFPFFLEKSFEADDWAGLAYRLHQNDRQMFLSTVDRDWSMLVDDQRGIYFANVRRSRAKELIQQRLVDNEAVIHHTKHKLKVDINHPRELAFAKSEKGDMGDNLPPGAPVYMFDLCEPPDEWKLENYCPEKVENFKAAMYEPSSNIHLDHLARVKKEFPDFIEGVSFRGE